MAKKLVKGFYRFIEFVLGFVIILTILLFIRLSKGPIDIKNLSMSLLENTISEDSGVEITMKNAVLDLALSRGSLVDIRVEELSVLDKGNFAITVEKANVSFNPFWLFLGRFAPRDVELIKPYVQLNLANAQPEQVQKQTEPVPFCRKLNRLRRYLEQLDSLKLEQGEMAFVLPENESILLPDLEISLTHEDDDDDKMDIVATGRFSFDDTSTEWRITLDYDLDDKEMLFETVVDNIDLSKIDSVVPMLKGTELVLNADFSGKMNLTSLKKGWQEVFEDVKFKMTTKKAGVLHLPEPLNTNYQIQEALIKGQVAPKFSQINLIDNKIKILDKTISVNGKVSGLATSLDTMDFSKLAVSLTALVNDIPIKEVPDLWPSYLGTDAHQWIKENVTQGNIKNASLLLDITGEDVDRLISVLEIEGVTVRYVDEMKPLKDGKGVVTLEKDSAKIEVTGGHVDNVQATGGYVNFLDLDKDIPVFDMDVQFKGSVPDLLSVVSTKPLLVCDDMPIPCKSITGNATGQVQLNFPFVDENFEEQIKYSVSADLEEVTLPVPKTKWDVSEGSFKLFVNNNKLTLQGRGLLDEKPMQLDISHLFEGEAKSVYTVRMPVTASMIAPYFDRIDNFLKGSLFANVTIRPITDKKISVGLEVGLKDAEISLPIGYVKEFNERGTLKATLSIVNEKLESIPSIYLSMLDDSLLIKGKVDFPKGKVFEAELSEIKAERTDASLSLSYFKNESFDVKMTGKTADISGLLHGDFFSVRQTGEEKSEIEKVQDFSVEAKVDTLYLSADKEPFKDVSVQVVRKGGHWQKIEGVMSGQKPLKVSLNKEKKQLTLQTENVGDVLNRAGFTDRIKGGRMDSSLSQEKDGSLKGTIKIKDYELTETDFFMQAATLLGIMDAVRGDTISFNKAIIPFTLSPTNAVKIEDGVAFGTAVGVTFGGTVDSENIDLSGSVAPAYALNSLPGKIPVVGSLLSGEEGGGLFGVSYTIKGKTSNPETSFNPASLLAPGIFRRLFDVF